MKIIHKPDFFPSQYQVYQPVMPLHKLWRWNYLCKKCREAQAKSCYQLNNYIMQYLQYSLLLTSFSLVKSLFFEFLFFKVYPIRNFLLQDSRFHIRISGLCHLLIVALWNLDMRSSILEYLCT